MLYTKDYVFMTVLLVQLITNIEILLSFVDNSATHFSGFLQKHIKCYFCTVVL